MAETAGLLAVVRIGIAEQPAQALFLRCREKVLTGPRCCGVRRPVRDSHRYDCPPSKPAGGIDIQERDVFGLPVRHDHGSSVWCGSDSLRRDPAGELNIDMSQDLRRI